METNNVLKFFKKNVLLWILVALVVFFALAAPNFFTYKNLFNIFTQNAYLMIASMGVALVMICGGTDLSSGMMMSVVAVCVGACMKWAGLPVPVSIIIGCAIGVGLGLFNGFATNLLRIHSMIITLGTMTIFQGVSFLISKSQSIYDLPASFKKIGQGYIAGVIPIPVIIVVVIAVIIHLVCTKTFFGRFIFASGGNPEAARLAGVNVNRVKLIVFALCGLLCSIASIVMVARAGSANSSMGSDVVFNAITACVLGGVSFIGGEGDVKGVIIGTLILGVLSNGMQLVGMGIYIQYVVKGAILLISIGYDTYSKQSKVKKVKIAKAAA